jgi:hypothetical protein
LYFPHGPGFPPSAAPALASFDVAVHENDLHVVDIASAAHPNTGGVANVSNGKANNNAQQAFGNAHGARWTNWLNATMKFVTAAHTTIKTNRVTLSTILTKIFPLRLMDVCPTKVAVGEDESKRLVDSLNAMENCINGAVARRVAVFRSGMTNEIGGSILVADAAVIHQLPAAADAAVASTETKRWTGRLAGMMTMFTHLDAELRTGPPVVSPAG